MFFDQTYTGSIRKVCSRWRQRGDLRQRVVRNKSAQNTGGNSSLPKPGIKFFCSSMTRSAILVKLHIMTDVMTKTEVLSIKSIMFCLQIIHS